MVRISTIIALACLCLAVPATSAPTLSFRDVVLAHSPEAFWEFDGAMEVDSSGNGHTLATSSASIEPALLATGPGLGALLSGNQVISVDVTHSSTTARTFLGWFRVGSESSDKKAVLYAGPLQVYRRNARELELTVSSDGSVRLTATAVTATGRRHAKKYGTIGIIGHF